MHKIKKRLNKKTLSLLTGLFVVCGAFFAFWFVKMTHAGAITDMSISVNGTTYTITLTPSSTIPAGGKINVNFRYSQYNATLVTDLVSKGAGTTAAIDTVARGESYYHLVATAGSEIAGGTEVIIVAENLQNPPDGKYGAIIWTAQANDTAIDGTHESTSIYRTYYTIGAPVIVGRVLDPDGDPVSGAWVNASEINDTSGNPQAYGYDSTDELGYYSIGTMQSYDENFEAGDQVSIMAYAPGDNFVWGNTEEYQMTYEGSTITKNMQFVAPTKTISGTFKYADGTPIEGARINIWSMDGAGYSEATTNSSGEYSALVKGGKWDIMPDNSSASGWAYSGPPMSVSFAKTTDAESQTVNLVVQRANATITGTVHLPNGSAPSNPQNFSVNAFSMNGCGSNGQLQQDGTFSMNVPAGSYQIDVMDFDLNYASPSVGTVSVGENETIDTGVITLQERNSYITGHVLDSDGNTIGVGGSVFAHQMKEGGWANAQFSHEDGSFSLKVFPGNWMVEVPLIVDGSNNYVLESNPGRIKVVDGQTVDITITMVKSNATITGNIVDQDGNIVTDSNGFVFADKAGSEPFMGPPMGGTVNRGVYTVSVPAGTYMVGMGMMPGDSYSSSEPEEITVEEDQSVTHNITVYENDMTVTGTIKDEDGETVTGIFMEVYATNKYGGWQNAFVNQSNGTYSMGISSQVDPWSLGYFVDPTNGYFSETLTDNAIEGDSGETITKNITLRKADATISGTVLDGDGTAMSDVMVFADNRSGSQNREGPMFMGPMFMNDNTTDQNGEFSIEVPSGTYYVSATLPRDQRPDLINPNRVEVTLEEDGTASGIQLQFRNADCQMNGAVTLDGEAYSDAYVWGWSESGGYNETEADDSGNFTMNVTKNDTWHIGVNSDIESSNDYVKSTEKIYQIGDQGTIEVALELETVEDGLVQPVSTTFTASTTKIANLSDGTMINIPANAMGTEGNVTLNASTTSELPRTTNSKPVSTGLELTASSSTGSAVTSFNSNVTVTIDYDEDALGDLMVTEDDLVAAYWDETSGMWKPLNNYSIDKENNQVTFSTSHFTTFGLVSDTVGGELAEDEEEDDSGSRPKIYSWKAEKYSTLTEKIKEKLRLVIKGLHFDDDAVVEIGNKDADSVRVTDHGKRIVAKFEMEDLLKKYNPKRVVRVTNPDGKNRKAPKRLDLRDIPTKVETDVINCTTPEGASNVQQILKNLGFYAHSEITGYCGPITQQAVMEFQRANGLPPVGVVGPQTTAKLLEQR